MLGDALRDDLKGVDLGWPGAVSSRGQAGDGSDTVAGSDRRQSINAGW
jgi:hypothetical protein